MKREAEVSDHRDRSTAATTRRWRPNIWAGEVTLQQNSTSEVDKTCRRWWPTSRDIPAAGILRLLPSRSERRWSWQLDRSRVTELARGPGRVARAAELRLSPETRVSRHSCLRSGKGGRREYLEAFLRVKTRHLLAGKARARTHLSSLKAQFAASVNQQQRHARSPAPRGPAAAREPRRTAIELCLDQMVRGSVSLE